MAACFFKASNAEREKEKEGQERRRGREETRDTLTKVLISLTLIINKTCKM